MYKTSRKVSVEECDFVERPLSKGVIPSSFKEMLFKKKSLLKKIWNIGNLLDSLVFSLINLTMFFMIFLIENLKIIDKFYRKKQKIIKINLIFK